MTIVYARQTIAVGCKGEVITMRAGDPFDSDDYIVKARPGLFTPPVKEEK